jgi:ABC-2 type transport system permease protein
MLAANALGFWTLGSRGPVAFLAHGVSELAKFPLTVYPRFLAAVLTWCLPFAFLSFYPARALLGAEGAAVWLAPLAGLGSVAGAALVWRGGLRRYEGTGS